MNYVPFAIAVVLLVACVVGLSSISYFRARRASRSAWTELLKRLQPVDKVSIREIALDLLNEQPTAFGSDALWHKLGGMAVLRTIDANCNVLVDLAAHVSKWYPEAEGIADDLRANAREIRWHVSRLQAAEQTGHQREQFVLYAQRAVATYYLMTRSLLLLYEHGRLEGLEQLQGTL